MSLGRLTGRGCPNTIGWLLLAALLPSEGAAGPERVDTALLACKEAVALAPTVVGMLAPAAPVVGVLVPAAPVVGMLAPTEPEEVMVAVEMLLGGGAAVLAVLEGPCAVLDPGWAELEEAPSPVAEELLDWTAAEVGGTTDGCAAAGAGGAARALRVTPQ